MLKIDMPAPDFSLFAYFPKEKEIRKVGLKDYFGKWVILSFHPGDFTFTCSTDLGALNKIVPILEENNAMLFGVSIDSVYVHKIWIETSKSMKDMVFPIIGDQDKIMSIDYGALDEKDSISNLERVTVIINPDGIVKYIEKADPRLGKDGEQILHKLIGLKYLYEHNSTEKLIIILPADWKKIEEAININIPEDIGKI